MKIVRFEEAERQLQHLFDLAVDGEMIVIERADQCVVLHRVKDSEIAPPGYFAQDYSQEEAAELNAFASLVPQTLLR
jgi:hypothetical protein